MEFVTLYRPHRAETQLPGKAELEQIKGGYALKVKLSDGEFIALLPADEQATLNAFDLKSKGAIKIRLVRNNGLTETLGLDD